MTILDGLELIDRSLAVTYLASFKHLKQMKILPDSFLWRLTMAGATTMFDHAGNFDIGGGLFMPVTVNQLPASPPPTVTPKGPAPIANVPPATSTVESEVYARNLLPRKKGYPLWKPKPDERLPIAYRKDGIRIGDVGILNEFGGFDYLFNACRPEDDPINVGRVPAGFKPIVSESLDLDIRGTEQEYRPGSYVASRDSDFRKFNIEVSERIKGVPREVGGGIKFQSIAYEGALLVLPEGGMREDHLNLSLFANYAAECAKSWYGHINGPLGRRAPNGSLYLVTGCDKARCWGVASFTESEPGSVDMEYVPIPPENAMDEGSESKPEYEFRVSHSACTDSGSDSMFGNQSGCVFVRGFRIALRPRSWWEFLTGKTPVDISGPITHSQAQDFSPKRYWLSLLQSKLTVEEFPSKHEPYHPANAINQYILKMNHEAEVVLTHDDQWCSILSDSDEGSMPTDEELIRRMTIQFEIVFENGYARFEPKGTAQQPRDESVDNTPQRVRFPEQADSLTSRNSEVGSLLLGESIVGGRRRRNLSTPSFRGSIPHHRSSFRAPSPLNNQPSSRSRSLSIVSSRPQPDGFVPPYVLVSPPTPSPEHARDTSRLNRSVPNPLAMEDPSSQVLSITESPRLGHLSAISTSTSSTPTEESFTLSTLFSDSPPSTMTSLPSSPPSIHSPLSSEFPGGISQGSEGRSGSLQLSPAHEARKSPRARKPSIADTRIRMLNPIDLIVDRWRTGVVKDSSTTSNVDEGPEEGQSS